MEGRTDSVDRDARPSRRATDPVELSWLVTVRWTTMVAAIGAVVAGTTFGVKVPVAGAVGIVAAIALSNLWLMWRIRGRRTAGMTTIAGVIVCGDVLVLSLLILRCGGLLNPASVFYLVEIVLAALVLGRLWTWIVTTLAAAGYAALFLVPSEELLTAQGMHPEIALHMRGMWLAFALTAPIVAVLVARLAFAIERRDRALELMRDRAVRASRFAGLATVAAGAAHELGTPLATMVVAAHELERSASQLEGHPELVADAQLIRAEADRCRRLLDQMAAKMAEPMGEAPRTADLDAVLSAAVTNLSPAERARVSVSAAAGPTVVWPVGVVAQAIGNVLRNALQASPPGEAARVEALHAADGRVRIVTSDRGRGMTPEELARAGEPFFTTKPPGVGTGLGLFVTRSSVEQLGGTFELTSAVGAGTTATILLPRDVTLPFQRRAADE